MPSTARRSICEPLIPEFLMPTPVVMPQMGESIAEGTIVRWIKKVGDAVERDEPLFEITTDKVDAEIPAPAAGVLAEIAVAEGQTVAVNSVVGTIAQPGETIAPTPATTESAARAGAAAAAASTQQQPDGQPARAASPRSTAPRASSPTTRSMTAATSSTTRSSRARFTAR